MHVADQEDEASDSDRELKDAEQAQAGSGPVACSPAAAECDAHEKRDQHDGKGIGRIADQCRQRARPGDLVEQSDEA